MFSAERWRTEELQKERPMWTAQERALDNAQEVSGTNQSLVGPSRVQCSSWKQSEASKTEVCCRDSGCDVGCQGVENVD